MVKSDMAKISPTLRERHVFAALMEEFVSHMPPGNQNFPTAGTYMINALNKVKAKSGRMQEAADFFQACIDEETSRTDYRG